MLNGDIQPEHPHGLFVQDARILSGWSLTVDGQPLEPLTAETKEPYRALFVGRVPRTEGYADSPLIVERLREVGAGIQEQITVRNYSLQAIECVITVKVEADFADLFEVKEARIRRRWDQARYADGGALTVRAAGRTSGRARLSRPRARTCQPKAWCIGCRCRPTGTGAQP
jgi:hypothetical protein